MKKLTAMTAFCTVVETGAFSRAAQALGMSTTAVSRHVQSLEQHLGARLLLRSTRHLVLTDTGHEYYRQCQDILERIAAAETAACTQDASARGLLRISVPHGFGQAHIIPVLLDFKAAYPEMILETMFTDRPVDLVHEGIDLAIRITGALGPNLIARRLAGVELHCCASPDYLQANGRPEKPGDLKEHNCLTYSYAGFGETWTFLKSKRQISVRVKGTLRGNNGEMLRQACCAGVGITLLPAFHVNADIRAGRLLPVLEKYTREPFGAYAVYLPEARRLAKIKLLLPFLERAFSNLPD